MRILVLAILGAVVALPVSAACRDDLPALKTRISHETDKVKKQAAEAEYGRAEKEARGSEIDCMNAVSRARKALNAEPVVVRKPGEAALSVTEQRQRAEEAARKKLQ